jgi:microcin C transport system substrate-binding protein
MRLDVEERRLLTGVATRGRLRLRPPRPALACAGRWRWPRCLALGLIAVGLSGCGDPFDGEAAFVPAPVEEALEPPVEPIRPSSLPPELPAGLEWITNDTDPEFAAPEAIRGGTFRTWMPSFPLTLRRVGPDSNGGFAAYTRYIQMPLVSFHPVTRRPMPALASHWAFGDDGRTVYYRLDPDARWSDGQPVTADDFVFTLEFMRSKEIVAPWYNNQYTSQIVDIRKYDDRTIGVEAVSAKPPEELIANFQPQVFARHFFTLGRNWVRDYNWRIEPTTGAYRIAEVRKGKYVELARVEDWWANDRRYYRNRFNPDKIRVKVIRDQNVAFRHFLKGEIDTYPLVLPQLWHERASGEVFDKGYVERYWFYYQNIQSPAGMFLNLDDPLLADRDVRLGIAHAMNFDHVIQTVLRNDYERMQTFNEGYGEYDNKSIRARPFDIRTALDHFAAAGFDTRGPDGILMRGPERLSVRVSYGAPTHTERLVVLKEEAKKAGLELVLELKDGASAFKQVQEKKHQIGWMAWAGQGLSPTYWEFWHSVNAHKPQTNNIVNMDDPEMDRLIDRYLESTERAERIALAHAMEERLHESGAFIPSFRVPFTREAAWRWMKLPAGLGTPQTEVLFNPLDLSDGIYSSGGLFWIDVADKQRTRDARDRGETFPAAVRFDDRYRP